MNKLKFRVWDAKKREYIVGLGSLKTSFEGELYYFSGHKKYTIEQFTGIHDSNKKMVYIGDIIRLIRPESNLHHLTGFVNWDDLTKTKICMVDVNRQTIYSLEELLTFRPYPMDFEIIGNIHENKDL